MTYLLPLGVLRNVVKTILRQSPRITVRRKALRAIDQEIYALLSAVGANVNNSEFALAFREAVDKIPSEYAMGETF